MWQLTLRNVNAGTPDEATYIVKHNVLVMACGPLSQPRMPEGISLDVYQGTHFHSQHWRHDVTLGKFSTLLSISRRLLIYLLSSQKTKGWLS